MKRKYIDVADEYGYDLHDYKSASELYDKLYDYINNDVEVTLDFKYVQSIHGYWIGGAICPLYQELSWKKVDKLLKLRGLSNELNRLVIQTINGNKTGMQFNSKHRK